MPKFDAARTIQMYGRLLETNPTLWDCFSWVVVSGSDEWSEAATLQSIAARPLGRSADLRTVTNNNLAPAFERQYPETLAVLLPHAAGGLSFMEPNGMTAATARVIGGLAEFGNRAISYFRNEAVSAEQLQFFYPRGPHVAIEVDELVDEGLRADQLTDLRDREKEAIRHILAARQPESLLGAVGMAIVSATSGATIEKDMLAQAWPLLRVDTGPEDDAEPYVPANLLRDRDPELFAALADARGAHYRDVVVHMLMSVLKLNGLESEPAAIEVLTGVREGRESHSAALDQLSRKLQVIDPPLHRPSVDAQRAHAVRALSAFMNADRDRESIMYCAEWISAAEAAGPAWTKIRSVAIDQLSHL